MADVIHAELLQEHGGTTGVREGGEDLIESALARPRNKFAYDPECDLADLAAAHLFGFVKNHGYVDGNKRVGFAVAATFLLLNGRRLTASEEDAYSTVIGLAESRQPESEIADWFRRYTRPAE